MSDVLGFGIFVGLVIGTLLLVGQCASNSESQRRYYECLDRHQEVPFKERKEMCTLPKGE